MDWNKLYIHPSNDTTDEDIRDFIECVSRKGERLGFKVELKWHKKSESGSTDVMSTNPLDKSDETHQCGTKRRAITRDN